MAAGAPQLKIKLQVYCGEAIAMGPGKADLLDAIVRHGSISAAARALGMSYRRAWLLVDTMNRCWAEPLVLTVTGGAPGSGASLSPLGTRVLGWYRALLQSAGQSRNAPEWTALAAALRPRPAGP